MLLRFSASGKWLACVAATALLAVAGCRENTIINSNLAPAIDNINTFGIGPEFNNGTDTITMHVRTVYDDSVVTSGSSTGFAIIHGLGAINQDPFFGKTAASIYLQVVPSSTSFSFKADDVIDSTVLILPYSGFSFGDTTMAAPALHFSVYPITDSLSIDSTYYTFTEKAIDAAMPYGTATVSPYTIKDSVTVVGQRRAPHLRIPLNGAAADALRNAANTDNTFSDFTRAFKGIYITADSSMPGATIPFFRLDGTGDFSRANILVYYHNDGSAGGPPADSLTESFGFNPAYTAHYNRVIRNYTGSPAGAVINGDPSPVVLVQNGPGAAIDITLPNLKYLPKSIINKAQLILTQVKTGVGGEAVYQAPSRIFPQGVNPDGSMYVIADRFPQTSQDGLNFIDGVRRDYTTSGGETVSRYIINFPRELQRAVAGLSDSLHLRIVGTATFPGAYRAALGSNTQPNPEYRMQLNIVYSKQ